MLSTKPPQGLHSDACEVWKTVVGELIDAGTFEKVAASAVARYCEVVVLYARTMGMLLDCEGTLGLIEQVDTYGGKGVASDVSVGAKMVKMWLNEMHVFWKSFGFLDGATAKDRIGNNRDGEEITEEKERLRDRVIRLAERRKDAG